MRHVPRGIANTRIFLCAVFVATLGLVSEDLMGQGPGYTTGIIAGVMGDRLQVAVSDESTWILDLIQPCSWCQEGVQVIMRPAGPVRVTLERDIPSGIQRTDTVSAFVIHKSE